MASAFSRSSGSDGVAAPHRAAGSYRARAGGGMSDRGIEERTKQMRTYRPTLRSYTFAAFSANAIAERERRADEHFSGYAGEEHAAGHCVPHERRGHSCIICGITPAQFLDLQRGGFVCEAHKPER